MPMPASNIPNIGANAGTEAIDAAGAKQPPPPDVVGVVVTGVVVAGVVVVGVTGTIGTGVLS